MSGQELENWNADSVTSDLREQVEDLGLFEDPLRDIVYNRVSCKSVGWRKIVSDNQPGSGNGMGRISQQYLEHFWSSPRPSSNLRVSIQFPL